MKTALPGSCIKARHLHSAILLALGGVLAMPALAAAPPPASEASVAAPTAPSANSLKAVVQHAVLNNPEVLFRWHAFLAADHEHDASIGGYLPKLDLTAGRGKEDRDDPLLRRDYSRSNQTLTLTQMIYDGFLTRNEVKRLDHARMSRLFELQDASENIALEAVRAYLDVLRFRQLVALAEENYVRHRSVFEQIQLKVKAGVGRRVDLEQASGRLALAESNLLIDTSNLHDVSARFQRLTGTSPARDLDPAGDFVRGLPATAHAAQSAAQFQSPSLRAAVENVRAADAAHSGRYAAFQPRFDLRLRNDRGTNINGSVDSVTGNNRTDNKVAEVVMTWNLFNGFADINRTRQFAEQRNVARDLRDKACRDLRQTLAIAYNDTQKLKEQLVYLDQHQISIEKARDAYRKQFDIGQRTLLDVLDTENELFQARRAYTNAEVDLQLAQARAHAGMGNLFAALQLSRLDDAERKLSQQWAAEGEAAEQCPPEGPAVYTADKSKLDERAQELLRDLAPKTAAAVSDGVVAPPPATSPPDAEPVHAITQSIKVWQAAWQGRRVSDYLAVYAPVFIPADGSDLKVWQARRRTALERATDISLDVSDIKIVVRDASHALSTFTQSYRSAQFKDVVAKTLEWEKIDGRWLIVGEASKPAKR